MNKKVNDIMFRIMILCFVILWLLLIYNINNTLQEILITLNDFQ